MSTRRTLLTALLTTAFTLPGLAQTETPATDPAAPVAPAAPAVSVEGAAPAAAPVTRDKDTLSVDFPDEDIKTILRNVADLFELNLVVPDTLTGKTSIKLRDVTWRQIFQVVLSPVGYTYLEEGNIIKIVSNELLQQEPGATEVFILNNAKAADIKPTIDGLIDAAGGGKIVIDARSNALVITERPSRMSRIRSIIDQLDKATDQVMIESKFVEVTDRDVRNIGVNWASLSGMTLTVGGMRKAYTNAEDETTTNGNTTNNGNSTTTTNGNTSANGSNSGTSSGTENTTTNNASNAVTYVTSPVSLPNFATGNLSLPGGQLTGMPGSVPTNVSVANLDPVAGTFTSPNTYTGQISNNAGTTNSTTSGTSVSNSITSGVNNAVTNALNSLTGITNSSSVSRVATAVFSASDFNVIVSALKTQNNTKIVSNPTIVTLNNTEAVLNIGQEFPIPRYNYNSERGTFEVAGFDYKPIGVILKVTPQVNGRGVIKLVLEPEVSQQNGNTTFGGAGGANIPIIATRKAKTQVSLKDGYTMGIGGLITNVMNHGGTKVPILGDIPLLGRLFSSKSVNDEASNLLIFITAKTVSADGASPEEVFDPRAVEAIGMTREDLPGNRVSKGTDMFAPKPVEK
jgi:type II secretory pathway component GspD/PulD (secretin)